MALLIRCSQPRLIQAVAELLDVQASDLRLTQSDLWPKYGVENSATEVTASDKQDQRIHVDYPNHTLVHPTPWHRPEAQALRAELYRRERYVRFKPGTLGMDMTPYQEVP